MGIVAFNSATIPDHPETAAIISGRAALLDGAAQAAGYTVPVTATQAQALMKEMNTYGAACAAWHAGQTSEQLAPPRVEYWCGEFENFLAGLKDGSIQLPGLVPESDIDPVFEIAAFPNRSRYWRTRELEY